MFGVVARVLRSRTSDILHLAVILPEIEQSAVRVD
jgi:hypothetical protein